MNEDSEDDGGLGGNFDEDVFAEVGRVQIVDVPSEDSLNPSAIVRELARYLAPRLTAGSKISNCAFVYSPYLESDLTLMDGTAKRHHHLARSKVHDPSGRVHLVATGLNEGISIEVDCDDPEALHAWLVVRHLTDRPIVWVEADDRRMVWYPNGMADEGSALTIEIAVKAPIDAARIEDELRIFYENIARVPRSDPSFWHDSDLHVPCANTEKAIQKTLSLVFDVRFHDDLVVREFPLSGSVVDFVIHQVGSGLPAPICALELKVLREKHHNEDGVKARRCPKNINAKAVDSGIEQAAIARDELGTHFAYLAAFDMRAADDDAIMAAVAAKAKQLSVTGRRYFMYNSKKTYRAAVIAQTLAAGGSASAKGKTGP